MVRRAPALGRTEIFSTAAVKDQRRGRLRLGDTSWHENYNDTRERGADRHNECQLCNSPK